jgi:hypothetical protein
MAWGFKGGVLPSCFKVVPAVGNGKAECMITENEMGRETIEQRSFSGQEYRWGYSIAMKKGPRLG